MSHSYRQPVVKAASRKEGLNGTSNHPGAAEGLYNTINDFKDAGAESGVASRGRGRIIEAGRYDHFIQADRGRTMAARGIVPERGRYDLLLRAGSGPAQGQAGRLAHRPGGDTLLHIYTAGGKAPREAINDIADKLGATGRTVESQGHGISFKKGSYDRVIEDYTGRSDAPSVRANASGGGVSHTVARQGTQGQGHLARDAQTKRRYVAAHLHGRWQSTKGDDR